LQSWVLYHQQLLESLVRVTEIARANKRGSGTCTRVWSTQIEILNPQNLAMDYNHYTGRLTEATVGRETLLTQEAKYYT